MDPFSDAFDFDPVPFTPPVLQHRRLASGAPVLVLEDHSLPLVNLCFEFQHGYSHVPHGLFGAGVALDDLMRTGGTARRSPVEVDLAIEGRAIGLEIEVGQRSTSVVLNTLPRHLDAAVELLATMLREPGFDERILEVWKGKQTEGLLRRNDRPGPIANRYFKQLMYKGHPLGRCLELSDIEGLDVAGLRAAHQTLFRPQTLSVGLSGAARTDEVIALLDRALQGWQPAPLAPVALSPLDLRSDAGIFVIDRDLPQSSIVVGQPGGLRVTDSPEYFASRVLNFIMGSSGFTSRLTREMRTVRGYAYSARSSWGAAVDDQRPLVAVTETRTENTAPALALIKEIFQGFVEAPPSWDEVRLAQDNIRHSFLFEFELPSQVVMRKLSDGNRGLPEDWFDRYLRGIAEATPESVFEVGRQHLRPEGLTMVIVGKASQFMGDLEALGPVQQLELEP